MAPPIRPYLRKAASELREQGAEHGDDGSTRNAQGQGDWRRRAARRSSRRVDRPGEGEPRSGLRFVTPCQPPAPAVQLKINAAVLAGTKTARGTDRPTQAFRNSTAADGRCLRAARLPSIKTHLRCDLSASPVTSSSQAQPRAAAAPDASSRGRFRPHTPNNIYCCHHSDDSGDPPSPLAPTCKHKPSWHT
jgi:hypothetical protein